MCFLFSRSIKYIEGVFWTASIIKIRMALYCRVRKEKWYE